MDGYVYVISNKAMPGLVKVGFTTRTPEERASELDGSHSPYPPVVEYSAKVTDARAVEQDAHKQLKAVCAGKEWFRCKPERAIAAIKEAAGESLRQERSRAQDARCRKEESARAAAAAEEAARKRVLEEAAAARKSKQREQIIVNYDVMLKPLERVPHFFIFYVIGVLITALGYSVVLSPRGDTGQLAILGFMFCWVPGAMLHGWTQKQKKQAPQYKDLIARRDAELRTLGS
jgi:hypothetical protein